MLFEKVFHGRELFGGGVGAVFDLDGQKAESPFQQKVDFRAGLGAEVPGGDVSRFGDLDTPDKFFDDKRLENISQSRVGVEFFAGKNVLQKEQ